MYTCMKSISNPIKKSMLMRDFLRNIRKARETLESKHIMLLQNRKGGVDFVIMTLPKFQEMNEIKEKPTFLEFKTFLTSVSPSWKSMISPVKWQKKVRSEWEK